MLYNAYFKKILILMFVPLLFGCQTVGDTVGETLNLETNLQLNIDVETDVNPDDNKKPAPLFIRFYELKSDNVFKKTEFVDLFERDSEILGSDLLKKRELKRFVPGESRQENFVLDPETRFVAFFSEFIDFSNAKYHLTIPIKQNSLFKNKVFIEVAENSMKVKKEN